MNRAVNPKKIAVFGLGYVGIVTAACLARKGHEVIGVEVNPLELSMMRDGQSPTIEPRLPEILPEAVAAGRLRVTASPGEAVLGMDLSCAPAQDQAGSDRLGSSQWFARWRNE